LFIKGLDDRQTDLESNARILGIEIEKTFSEENENLRWKNFKQLGATEMYDVVSKKAFPSTRYPDELLQSSIHPTGTSEVQ